MLIGVLRLASYLAALASVSGQRGRFLGELNTEGLTMGRLWPSPLLEACCTPMGCSMEPGGNVMGRLWL